MKVKDPLIYIVILLCISKVSSFQTLVSSSNNIVSGTSNHVFVFSGIGDYVFSNSYIQIQYDPVWNLGLVTGKDAVNDFCETGCLMTSVGYSIISNKVKITGLFPNLIDQSIYVARYTLKNLINPSTSLTSTITINLCNSDGSICYNGDTNVLIEPVQMVCTGVPTNPQISAVTSFAFTVNPSTSIPSTGYMTAVFPTQWADSAQTSVLQSPSCTNVPNTIACVPFGSSTLKLTGLISGSGPSSFAFTIFGIRNPGSTGINQQLALNYYTLSNQLIGRCTIQISNLTPKTLTGVSFQLNCQTSGQTISVLQLTITQIPKLTDKMILTLPSQIQSTYLTKVFVYAGSDTNQLNRQVSIETKTASNSQISFYPFANEAINSFKVQLYNLKCPPTTKVTNNIQIDVQRMGNIIMTYQNSGVQSTLPVFKSVVVSLEDNRMAQVTNYHFAISINQTIGVGAKYIDFIFPSSYNLVTGQTYVCQIEGYSVPSNTLCSVTSSTQISLSLISGNLSLILSTLKSVSVTSTLQLNIKIFKLKNPSSSTVSYDIYISDSSHYHLQGLTSISHTLVAALISGVDISLASYKVNQLTSYDFKVNNTNALAPNSFLRIKFPIQVKLQSPSCKINSVGSACSPSVANGQDVVLVTLPNAVFGQYALYSYTITVVNVRNRQSYEPSDSFGLQLQSGGVILEGIYQGLTVKMSQVSTLNSPTIVPVDNTVYSVTKYDISYTLPFTIDPTKSYKLKFTFPSQFKPILCQSCSEHLTFPITSASGTLTIDKVLNPYKTTITSAISYELRVDNYLSLQGTYLISTFLPMVQSFIVSYSNNVMGQPAVYWVSMTGVKDAMREVRVQLPAEVIVTVSVLNVTCSGCEVTSFSNVSNLLKVNIKNIQSQNILLQISGVTNPKVSPSSTFSIQTYTIDSVLVSKSTSTTQFFAIVCSPQCATCYKLDPTLCSTCYQDPSINNLKYFHNSSQTCISGCSPGQFQANLTCYSCNPKCNTCSNQASNCTTCTGLYSLFNNECILNCPEGYYSNSNACQKCIPPCLTCTSSSNCLYCVYGQVLAPDFTCQNNCPIGHYNKSNICVSCPMNCSSCTASICLTCIANNYMINGNCLSDCPSGYFIDSISKNCESCQSPCKSCSTKSNNCTSCLSSSLLPYYLNNQCYNICPPTFFKDKNNNCQPCVPPCLNCNSQTNCTSCQPSYLFYPNTNQCFLSCLKNTIKIGQTCQSCTSFCLQCTGTTNYCTSCVQNYFLDETLHTCNSTCDYPYVALNRICRKCVDPCANCNSGKPYECTSCIAGYYLLQNNCYQTCPSKTYANAGYCKPCTSGCYECVTTSATCTACYPGTYLFGTSCLPNCPKTPTYFYEYESQCIACQSPCKTCLSTPVQCQTCLSSSDYWNPVTLKCTSACSGQFFSVIVNGAKQCKSCELPCKQCSSSYDKCSKCYNGKYLHMEQCIDQCPVKYYADSNQCIGCPELCQTCTKSKCMTCQSNAFLFRDQCVSECPSQAPYPYLTYCRNCLKDYCLLCNDKNQCVMCFENYYLFNGSCLDKCPQNYELDTTTGLACVKMPDYALFEYLKKSQTQKIMLFSGTIITIFIIGFTLLFEGNFIIGSYALLSIPETLATIIFTYLYFTHGSDLKLGFTIPFVLPVIVIGLGLVISCFFVIRKNKILLLDENFKQWYSYGSNQKRTTLVLILSLINFKLNLIIFSGFLKLPFTSFQLKNKDLMKYLNWVSAVWIVIYSLPLIFITAYIIIAQKAYLVSNKVFYSALDCLLVQVMVLILTLAYLIKSHSLPEGYKKFIIQKVSTFSIPPLSEPNDYIGNQQDDNLHLYHSNSAQQIKKSEEMKQVDFKSVYDPSDFEDPPKVPPKLLQSALKKGKFRTKEKPKKKGKGKYKLDQLQIIEQEDSQEQKKTKNKQKTFKRSNKKSSLVNNYIYWQPPKKEKNRAEQVFKENRQQIMQKIYQKESQFDTITNNDIIFLEQSDDENQKNNSMQGNNQELQSNNQSKRQLNPIKKIKYDNLLNLNYAQKKHLS